MLDITHTIGTRGNKAAERAGTVRPRYCSSNALSAFIAPCGSVL